ncbi:hypothetical protein [Candidatus Palauibacter sp.]|uniref:hypothetical protein n=1 Tax=Candidatus Palauibacter sp. TaxID=3101350 RepID=UPI003B51CEFD
MIQGLAARAACPRLLFCMLAALSACAGAPPGETSETGGEIGGEALAVAVDARYLTHLLFAADDGTAFVASFDQTAEGEDLRLDYDVRLAEGDSWRPLMRAQDTLSVARAAWRLLPARGMAVRVGDAGQVVSLLFSEPADRDPAGENPAGGAADTVRLVAGEEVSVWTGPTGQRESLGIAALQTGDRVVPGILFFRRAARALNIPVAVTDGQTFVFADSLGNGLVVHAGAIGQPAVSHTWLHGVEEAWGDVTLEPPDPGGTFGPAWRFEIPGTTVRGSFRPLMSEDPADGTLIRMEATLYVGVEELHFNGFSATLPSP